MCFVSTASGDLLARAEADRLLGGQRGDEVRPRRGHALAVRLLLLGRSSSTPITMRVDAEVGDRLRAERLDQLEAARRSPAGRGDGPRRCRSSARTPSTTSRRLAAAHPGEAAQRLVGERDLLAAEHRRRRVPFCEATVAASRFIGGVPMKPATNRFAGVVVEPLRRVDLLQHARGSSPRRGRPSSSPRPGRA